MFRYFASILFFAAVIEAQVVNGIAIESTPPAARYASFAPIGNSIVQVIDSLLAAGALKHKGEYATTELAFVLPRKTAAGSEYKADTGEMNVILAASLIAFDEAPFDYPRPGSFVLKPARTGTDLQRGIILDPSSPVLAVLHVEESAMLRNYKISFPLNVDQACALKPFLRASVVGRLAQARVYKAREMPGAMAGAHSLFVPFLVEEIRVIDIRSGEPIRIFRQAAGRTAPNGEGYLGGGLYRIGGGVSAPIPVLKVEPKYSEEARRARFQGSVVLSIEVDETGHPRSCHVIRRLGLGLDEKAIEAVQKWRFRPALKDGKPVAVVTMIQVAFKLR